MVVQDGVGRHPGGRPRGSSHPRVMHTNVGFERVGPHHRLDIVPGVVGLKRPHNRQLVGERRQLPQRIAKPQSRHRSLGDARHGADARGRIGLGVEGFVLAGAALLKQKDDRLAAQRARTLERTARGLNAQQRCERQPAEAQAADPQELAAVHPVIAVADGQHGIALIAGGKKSAVAGSGSAVWLAAGARRTGYPHR